VRCEDLTRWQDETCEPLKLHAFPGDHFFIQSAREAVLAQLDIELADLIAQTA